MKLIANDLDERFLRKKRFTYTNSLLKAILMAGYLGLLRIGEMTESDSNHTICFSDVHFEPNREKVLLVLHSSKTHCESNKPQIVKINCICEGFRNKYCPCEIISDYTLLRGVRRNQHFFITKDGASVKPDLFHSALKDLIDRLGLEPELYDMHSLRKGRAKDLFKMGYSIDKIKDIGRWRSNVVYEYFK